MYQKSRKSRNSWLSWYLLYASIYMHMKWFILLVPYASDSDRIPFPLSLGFEQLWHAYFVTLPGYWPHQKNIFNFLKLIGDGQIIDDNENNTATQTTMKLNPSWEFVQVKWNQQIIMLSIPCMFIAAQLTISKIPSTDDWINKMLLVHAVKYPAFCRKMNIIWDGHD